MTTNNNNFCKISSELSNDSEGFLDNLAQDSDLNNMLENTIFEYSTDHSFEETDDHFDWYLDTVHDFNVEDDGSGFLHNDESYDSMDYESPYSDFDFPNFFIFNEDSTEGKFGSSFFSVEDIEGIMYPINLIFDGKNYEHTIYCNKYIFKINDLALFLHRHCHINNFNLINKCNLLNFNQYQRSGDIIHVNGGFDKYLVSSWNRIMHALNGNTERDKERTHLPSNKPKIQTRQNEKKIKYNKGKYNKNVFVKKNVGAKVFVERTNRENALCKDSIKLDGVAQAVKENNEAPSVDELITAFAKDNNLKINENKETKDKNDIVIDDPNFDYNNFKNKQFKYAYSVPNTVPIADAQRNSTWFGYIPRLMLVPAGPDSWARYNCLIVYLISLLYIIICMRSFSLDSFNFNKMHTNTINLHNSIYVEKWNILYPMLYTFMNIFINMFEINSSWSGYFLVTFIKLIIFYYVNLRLYNRFYRLGRYLNLGIKPRCIGMTYYIRTITMKSKSDNIKFDPKKIQDFRRNVDRNFKINQETCYWSYDEEVCKVCDVGYWDDNYEFITEKTFTEKEHGFNKIADLELTSQMSTSKNVGMNSSPLVIAERMMNSTNLGPFIHYNRRDVFYNDVLNNSARLAHCIAMSRRAENISTDIYNQLFRNSDTMRLISIADPYSRF